VNQQESALSTPPEQSERPDSTIPGWRPLYILISPSRVFQTVAEQPFQHSNWLVPLLISTTVVILSLFAIQSNPHYTETNLRAWQVASLVDRGAINRAQGDQLLASLVPPASAAISVILCSFTGVFMSALILWLIGRVIFHRPIAYAKTLEVAALSSIVLALTCVITAFFVALSGNVQFQPTLALFITDFDPTNKVHLVLKSINLFQIWLVMTMATGLAKLCEIRIWPAFLWIAGYWILLKTLLKVLSHNPDF
jgi:hypothetical protein